MPPNLKVVLQQLLKSVLLPTQLMFPNHMAAAWEAGYYQFSTHSCSAANMDLAMVGSYLTDA